MVKYGDIYEDCSYHPVLCLELDGDDITGISLLDFSEPRSCSIEHCKPRKMSPDEVALRLRNREQWLTAEKLWQESGWEDNSHYERLLRLEANGLSIK